MSRDHVTKGEEENMNQHSRTILQRAGCAIVVIAALALAPATVRAQFIHALSIEKACPGPDPVPPGTMFQCHFSVQNQDPDNSVINLAVTNTVPFPGGVTTPVACKQDGVPVTVLGPLGSPTDTCTGSVDETAPACSGVTDFLFVDQIAVTGIDENNCPTCTGTPIPVSGSVTNGVLIDCCPPDTPRIICVIARLLENIVLIKQEIILLPGELFPAPGNRRALLNGLDTAERKLEDQKLDDAGKALNDLLKHLDGCVSADGTPDSNDWINSCAEQTRIWSLIEVLITEIGEI
jgi:hypothetical protein